MYGWRGTPLSVSTTLPSYLPSYHLQHLSSYQSTFLPIYPPIYLHPYLPVFLRTFTPSYVYHSSTAPVNHSDVSHTVGGQERLSCWMCARRQVGCGTSGVSSFVVVLLFCHGKLVFNINPKLEGHVVL